MSSKSLLRKEVDDDDASHAQKHRSREGVARCHDERSAQNAKGVRFGED